MPYSPRVQDRSDRYTISRQQYISYQRHGFLIVRALVPPEDVEQTLEHADDIINGRVEVSGIERAVPGQQSGDFLTRFSRVHMLHRNDAESERMMLHPRILDVLEGLIGPDVLALQTMLFYNPPGQGGQGWHQDAYYITTYPDTLIGAWLALDTADEENGCVWVAPGSHVEPIHPDPSQEPWVHAAGSISEVQPAVNASFLDDNVNSLAPVAAEYGGAVPARLDPGDVLFFHGHILHRSYPNKTPDRWRRAFVSHYCNARTWVPWNHGLPFESDAANQEHILARGKTHLPFAVPRFGTACAALDEAGPGEDSTDGQKNRNEMAEVSAVRLEDGWR